MAPVTNMRYDINWDKTPIFFAKTRNYDIFVAKIYDYAIIDSFWGFPGFIDSPTSYATLLCTQTRPWSETASYALICWYANFRTPRLALGFFLKYIFLKICLALIKIQYITALCKHSKLQIVKIIPRENNCHKRSSTATICNIIQMKVSWFVGWY